ncbi:hypothetical protein F4803DRAFT_502721 [Xylaria telfairii]|nr:hypothetical protein F4803DRAFT_502721 [Xylaria telfairii]
MFPRLAPDKPTGIPFCLVAKPTPLFLSSVDRVPCQLSPSETLHGRWWVRSWVRSPFHPLAVEVPVDGWRGLSVWS